MNAPACGPLDTGLWIDDPPSLVLRPAYLDRLRALGLEHVAVMVDGARPGLDVDQRWRADDVAALRAALPGVRIIISLWPSPSRAHLAEVREALPALLAASTLCQARPHLMTHAVELDVEPAGGWRARNVEGFVGLADAGRAWVEVCREAGAESVEVTTFPAAIPAAAGAIAAADVLALQVYPVATRAGAAIAYGGRLGPRRWPREALESARKRFQGKRLVCGLPAYKQTWPGRAPSDAMREAIASAVAGGAREIRWWSGKWAARKSTRAYAAPVIAAAGGRVT